MPCYQGRTADLSTEYTTDHCRLQCILPNCVNVQMLQACNIEWCHPSICQSSSGLMSAERNHDRLDSLCRNFRPRCSKLVTSKKYVSNWNLRFWSATLLPVLFMALGQKSLCVTNIRNVSCTSTALAWESCQDMWIFHKEQASYIMASIPPQILFQSKITLCLCL